MRSKEAIFAILLLLILFVLDVVAMHRVFTSEQPGANDFYPRWRGAQLFFLEGVNPYSEEATETIQIGIQGRPSLPDEDQLAFAYPFYTAFLLLPLLWLPYDWVQAIWLVVIQFSLVGGVLLYLQTIRWQLSPVLLTLTALWAVIFYHSARTILLGQFAGLIFLWTALLLWALSRRQHILAGVMLALITIKPQMSLFIILALLWWAANRRRWSFLLSSAGTMLVLLAISFLLLPTWPGDFVTQVLRYPSYTAYGNPLWIVSQYYLPQFGVPAPAGRILEVVLTLLVLAYMLWEWRRLPHKSATEAGFHYLVGQTLIVTNLVMPRAGTTNYVILYVPLFFAFRQLLRKRTRALWWLGFFYLTSIVVLWILFFATVQGDFESALMSLPLPLLLFLLFLLARQQLMGPSEEAGHQAVPMEAGT